MLGPVIRAVFEYAAGSKKDKGEDDRDHHVVVETTARMSPQDVTFQRAPYVQRRPPQGQIISLEARNSARKWRV